MRHHPKSTTHVLLIVLLAASITAGHAPVRGASGENSARAAAGQGRTSLARVSPAYRLGAGDDEPLVIASKSSDTGSETERKNAWRDDVNNGSSGGLRTVPGDDAYASSQPSAEAGGVSDARYALEQTAFDLENEIIFQDASTPSRQLVDIEMRWDGSKFLFSSIYYPVTGTIHSQIDVDETTFEAWANSMIALDGRFLDIEIEQAGSQRSYSGIFYEDGDDYASSLHTNIDEPALQAALQVNADLGLAIVDFESWENSAGETRYAGVWVNDPNQPRTHLYYGLEWADISDTNANSLLNPLHGRVIDVERYRDQWNRTRYALIVAQHRGGGWEVLRQQSVTSLANANNVVSDSDTHLIDIEAYDAGGGVIQFAGVWGDAWKSLNEIDALPPPNLIPLGANLNAIITNFESPGSDRIGIFGRSVRNNESLGYRQDEPFYLASTTKIAVHTRLWQLVEATHLDLDADMVFYGDPADPFYNSAFADSAVPWYVDERTGTGLATLTGGNYTSNAGQAITLRFLDAAMMQRSDNAATSMLVKDPTFGLAWDTLNLNEWLAGVSGVGQGWGVVTSIQDLDALIDWQGQHTSATRDQISLLRSPRAGLESVRRRNYQICTDGSSTPTGSRCRTGTSPVACSNPGDSCDVVIDPWGDLGAFLTAETTAGRTNFCPLPLNTSTCSASARPRDFTRYYNMGLNSATPRALGMLQERLVNGIYDPPNALINATNTNLALNVMTEFSGLRSGSTSNAGTVSLPFQFASVATKGGIKGSNSGAQDPCSDSAIYRFGPDAVVLNMLSEKNSRGCTGAGGVRDILFFNPPNGQPNLAAAVLQQLTADLVTCAVGEATFSPSVAWAGRSFDVSCDVHNDGGIDSPAFDVTFVASTGTTINLNDEIIGTVRVPGIVAGGVATAQFSGSLPVENNVPGGDYNVGWVIDSNFNTWNIGEVGEWDETAASNAGFIPGQGLTVVDPPPPPCLDEDSDGYADCDPGFLCDPDNVTCGDCDDGNASRNPGAAEVCDQFDNDCNGVIDDGTSRAWAFEELLEQDPDSGDQMGNAMARVGDVNGDGVEDFVIGVNRDFTTGGDSAGSVYLYSGVDRQLLCIGTDPAGEPGDWLGFSVAGIGDVTGPGSVKDGIPDFVAGVPRDDDVLGNTVGSVVIFSGADCTFYRKLIDPNGAPADNLGHSVAGMWNLGTGNSSMNIAAGAPGSDIVDNGAGKVVVFAPVNGSVVLEFVDPAGGQSDALGTSLATFGPHTGGTNTTVVAGAPARDTSGQNDTGILVLFDGLSGTLLGSYSGPGVEASQRLGDSVITLPDITGDGIPEIAVGATGGDTSVGTNRGKVYILDGADGSFLRLLGDPAGASGDKFGTSIDWLANIPGDEIGIVVGSPKADAASGNNKGRILVFGAESGLLLASLMDPGGEALDLLGTSVAGVGDLTGDGYSEIATGSPDADGWEKPNAGKVLIFSLESDCDGDGVTMFGGDCGEGQPEVGPGFAEVCDGLDNDCDLAIDEDSDGDGFTVCDVLECDDSDPLRHGGAVERCNGLDDNCNGSIDEGVDLDGDGWETPCDCDDTDAFINPGAPDLICDQIDQDCSGIPDQGAAMPGVGVVLTDPAGRKDDELGTSVAAIGDVTGDGVPDVVAGVPWADLPGTSIGQVAVFDGASRQIHCFLHDPDSANFDALGAAVAGIGDINDDQVPDIVVGAPGDDDPVSAAGSVLVFSGADCQRIFKSTVSTGGINDRLGTAVTGLGDLNGDGKPEYAAGAPNADPGGLGAAGHVIVFSGMTGLEMYRLINTSPRGGDNFGSSIAGIGDIDADGVPDIIVGAPLDDTNIGVNAGSVSLYSGVDGQFIFKLNDSLGRISNELGFSVVGLADMDGDGVPDFAAGAPFDDDGGTNSGAVVIFSGRTGAALRKMTGSGPGTQENMGFSLARVPDINGDGFDDLAAGAPGDDTAGSNNGSVFLWSGGDGVLLRRLTDSGGGISEELGTSVAVVGDTTGDGVPEIAAGSPRRAKPEDTGAGAVVLFTFESDCDGDGTGPSTGDCDDTFADVYTGAPEICDTRDNDCDGLTDEDEDGDGFDVCSDCDDVNPLVYPGAEEVCNGIDDNCVGGIDEAGPDLDGDGFAGPCADCDETNIAINTSVLEICNAVDDNCDGQVDEGFALPLNSRQILDPVGGAQHNFGEALVVVGDMDGDGFEDFAAGVEGDDEVAVDSGAVVVFSGSSLAPLCRMTDPGAANSDHLGRSVAGGADLTGDGIPDVVAGADDEDSMGSASGAVYLFSGADCQLVRKMVDPDGQSGDNLGWSVAIIGDVTGDGVADIAAGSRGDDIGIDSGAGSVVIFSGATGLEVRKITNPDPRGGDRFGHTVLGLGDVDGDTVPDLAVGAYLNSTLNGNDSGSVSIFSGADGAWLRTLVIPGVIGNSYLGFSMARMSDLDGDGIDDILAGAYGVDDPITNAGVVVALSPRTGAVIRTYVDAAGTSNSEMGSSVAAVGDMDGDGVMDVLAGAPKTDTAGANAGEAVLFSGATGVVLQRFTDPFAAAGDLFGTAVLGLDNVTGGGQTEILVGAPLANTMAGSDAGALTIYSQAADCDGDGFGPLLDCDDTDIASLGEPGEAEDVLFADVTTMSWSPPAAASGDPNALAYDVIRSSTASDFVTAAVCTESADSGDTFATVTAAPSSSGEIHFFLIRTLSRCGLSTVGTDSADVLRSVRPCP